MPGSESDDSEEPKVQTVDSQATTVPAKTPEIEAAKAEARKQHEEALKQIELEKAQAGVAGGQGSQGLQKRDHIPPTTKRKPVKKTAAKSGPKAKVAKKPRKDAEPNPFDGPVDANQTRLDSNGKLVPPTPSQASSPVVPSVPVTKVPPDPPAKPQVQHSESMEDVADMLNRANTQELENTGQDANAKEDAKGDDVNLEDLSNMLGQDLKEKKEHEKALQAAMKPRTESQKTRHARRMRFYRSLTSHGLSTFQPERNKSNKPHRWSSQNKISINLCACMLVYFYSPLWV